MRDEGTPELKLKQTCAKIFKRRLLIVKRSTSKLRLIYFYLVLCILASLVVAGCSNSEATVTQPATTSGTITSASSSTPSNSTSSIASTTTTVSSSGIKQGGVLKIGIYMDAMILGDPLESRKTGSIMQRGAIEYLARFDDKGSLQPWLAESWSEDPVSKSFIVKVKKGIKFHDGTDLNASALKWNWERFLTAKSSYVRNVSSVDIIDEYTVKVNLNIWDNACAYNLCYWAGGVVSPTAWQKNGEEWGKLNAVGTGPFKFDSWEAESKISYKRFDDYWIPGKPFLDGIEFHIIADEATRSSAFEAGEIDMIVQSTIIQTHNLASTGKYEVIALKNGIGTRFDMIMFDAGDPNSVFSDIRVRKAVAHAIDREKIVNNIFYGYAVPSHQFGTPSNWAYNPNLTTYDYDPEKAKALLKEAGYTSIDTKITCFDNETQFVAIQGMLAEVGINAQVNLIPPGAWYQAATTGWEGLLHMPSPPDGDVSTRFGFTTIGNVFGATDELRPPENNVLVDAITSATRFEDKKALTQAYQERIFGELVSVVGLWNVDDLAVKYPYVKGDGFCIYAGNDWTPEDAWLDK